MIRYSVESEDGRRIIMLGSCNNRTATGTGGEYFEMSTTETPSTKPIAPDALKTLDATQLPKGAFIS